MYAFLRGSIAVKGKGHVVLDVNGLGYEVYVPDSTYRRLQLQQEVTLLTYCHIREDLFQIFGFLREEEKGLFIQLLGINKIGPKVALAVLSAMSVQAFSEAIQQNDVDAFKRVSGVGKAMAQRIVLEIRSKMGQNTELDVLLGTEQPEEASYEGDDVFEALISLGCTPQEARKATEQARKALGEDAPAEELVRSALRSMARVK